MLMLFYSLKSTFNMVVRGEQVFPKRIHDNEKNNIIDFLVAVSYSS